MTLARRFVSLLAAVLLPLLSRADPALDQIEGATARNISSSSSQLSFVPTWRFDTENGILQAYSNDSMAEVTFRFTGVGVSYIGIRKGDRGLCQLTVDNTVSYTLDLYDGSGYTQGQQIIWSSGTLPYGNHTVVISQLGPDARFGFYPFLLSETWVETVPTDVAAYTATQTATSVPTTNPNGPSSSTPVAPIIGGAVGGVVGIFLIAFLVYLWRRDRAARRRGEGAPVQKVKKAEGKIDIDDMGDDDGVDARAAADDPRRDISGGGYAGYSVRSGGRSAVEGWQQSTSREASFASHQPFSPAGASYGAASPLSSPTRSSYPAYEQPAYEQQPFDPYAPAFDGASHPPYPAAHPGYDGAQQGYDYPAVTSGGATYDNVAAHEHHPSAYAPQPSYPHYDSHNPNQQYAYDSHAAGSPPLAYPQPTHEYAYVSEGPSHEYGGAAVVDDGRRQSYPYGTDPRTLDGGRR